MSFIKYGVGLLSLITAVLLGVAGCGQKDAGKGQPQKTGEVKEPKEHPDGRLFSAGEKYHLRLKIDAARKEAHAKVLDDKAKEEVPLRAESITLSIKNGKPVQVELKAERPKGKDSTSIFIGAADALAGKVDFAKIEIQATIDGVGNVFKLDADH